jgi:hypothetical protein
MHHKHAKWGGDSAPLMNLQFFVDKEDVDRAGDRLQEARGKQKPGYQSRVPEKALDQCEKSFHAARGDKETKSSEMFDDRGLVVMVCRHDIPLFLANIDTPGEQHKYAISLLEKLFEHLPPQATVTAFYDIGCLIDQSIRKVSSRCSVTVHERALIPPSIPISVMIYKVASSSRLMRCMPMGMSGLASWFTTHGFEMGLVYQT